MGMCRYFFPVLFFLILPGDNLSSWFTCPCGATNKQLLNTKDVIRLNVDDDLVLTLPETEPVSLYFKGRRSQYEELCTVSNNVLTCNSDFKDRVSFNAPNLTVHHMQKSDSGLYIIQNMNIEVEPEKARKIKVVVSEKGGATEITGCYHQPVILRCHSLCSGSVKWIIFPNTTVAECNQTSCRCQEGYEIPRERYLKRNFSLTITAPEYSDMLNSYEYWCNDSYKDIFHLIIKAANVSVNLKAGDNLTLEVPNPDQVTVMFNQKWFYENPDTYSPDNQSWTSKALACIKLTKVTPNDSGVYSVMNGETKDVFYNYKVSVEDQVTPQPPNQLFLYVGISVVVSLVVGMFIGFLICTVRYKMCTNHSQQSDIQQSNPCCLEMINRSSTEQGFQNAPLMQD